MDAKAIPGYQLKKKLGAGAMAAVFLAREEKLDRLVALKIMSKKLLSDPSFAERFLREARIVASISHRNIVTVFDVGSVGDYHYMAMELLPGGDLSDKLKTGPSLEECVSYIKDIAAGLNYAASKNFIHRDIKPDNIMFGEDGRAVITDFGIARSTEAENSMTIAGSVIGTPQYMSPEQAGAKELDHRTDLYSLGIILYEMLTGRPPFRGDSAISTGVMHITQTVPPLPPKYAQFQSFMDRALAKNPEERFQSGNEMAAALAQVPLEAPDEDIEATMQMNADDISKALSDSGFSTKPDDELSDGFLTSSLNDGTAGEEVELSDEFLDIDAELYADEHVISSPGLKPAIDVEMLTPEDSVLNSESILGSPQPPTAGSSQSLDDVSLVETEEKDSDDEEYYAATREKRISMEKSSFVFPTKTVLLLLVLVSPFLAHMVYVNVLDKRINFFEIAVKASDVSFERTGERYDFMTIAGSFDRASKGFANFVSGLFGGSTREVKQFANLAPNQRALLTSFDNAMQDHRLFSPHFDCAELYLKDLYAISPKSEVVKVKSAELLRLSMDLAMEYAEAEDFDKAESLMNEASRVFVYSQDNTLMRKHQQVSSTIKIMR